jgi:hypothetical protein
VHDDGTHRARQPVTSVAAGSGKGHDAFVPGDGGQRIAARTRVSRDDPVRAPIVRCGEQRLVEPVERFATRGEHHHVGTDDDGAADESVFSANLSPAGKARRDAPPMCAIFTEC